MGNSQSEVLAKNLSPQQIQAWKSLLIENQRIKEEFDVICRENEALKQKHSELLDENVVASLELNSAALEVKSVQTEVFLMKSPDVEEKSCNTDKISDKGNPDPLGMVRSASTFTEVSSNVNVQELTEVRELLNEKDKKIVLLEKSLKQTKQEFEKHKESAKKVRSSHKATIAQRNAELKKKYAEINQLKFDLAHARECHELQSEGFEKTNEHHLALMDEYCLEIKRLNTEVGTLNTRLVNECLLSGSRQAHVEELKKQIADMAENSKPNSKLTNQLTKKSNEIAALKKEVEAKKKKIEKQAAAQTTLQFENNKLKTNLKSLQASQKQHTKKNQAALEKALNADGVDVVSVHLVAEVYKLYKEKSDLLEKCIDSQSSTKSSTGDESSLNLNPQVTPLDPVEKDSNTTSTVRSKTTCFCIQHEPIQKVQRSFDCSVCTKSFRMNNRLVFYPCCHGACQNCASKLTVCNMCQTPIQSKEKQFA